jgi:hypothetical protein
MAAGVPLRALTWLDSHGPPSLPWKATIMTRGRPSRRLISVTDQTLTVKGSRQAAGESRPAHYVRQELAYGWFERVFDIPQDVNGMLEITIPAPQLAAPKKIDMQLDGQAPVRKQITA